MTRWTPLLADEFTRLQTEVNQLFDQFFGGRVTWPTLAYSYPAVNVWEDENNVYAEAELPGMELNKIDIHVTDSTELVLRGERAPLEGQGVWHRRERGVGSFSRLITLPVPVDSDRAEARLEQGVLTITLPKSDVAKPKRITVRSE
jgi:HSP20 family protein